MCRSFQRIGWIEVGRFEEVAAAFGSEEHDGAEHNQEYHHAQNVFHGVIRMERDAVERDTVFIFQLFDFHAVGVVGAHFVQRNQMRHHQANQHQRHSNHVQGEEAVERNVGNVKVATNPSG